MGWRGRTHPLPDRAVALFEDHGVWAIYWRDHNLKFHEYQRTRPSKNVQTLLDWIAESGDPIFWGCSLVAPGSTARRAGA